MLFRSTCSNLQLDLCAVSVQFFSAAYFEHVELVVLVFSFEYTG